MDQQYQHLVQDLKSIESKFRGYVDQPHDPLMVDFANGIKRIIGDCGGKKNPHSLEDGIKHLIKQIEEIGESDKLMDFRHQRDLKIQLEKAREELRKFSNY